MPGSTINAQPKSAPLRAVRLGALDAVLDRRADGTIYIRTSQDIGHYHRKLSEPLEYWAKAAPDRVFLAQRDAIVARIEALLNAQRKPPAYLRDRRLLSRYFEDCFFTLAGVAPNLRGQLEEAHWAQGFKPRAIPGMDNDLVDPGEMLVRAFHLWGRTRWPGGSGRARYGVGCSGEGDRCGIACRWRVACLPAEILPSQGITRCRVRSHHGVFWNSVCRKMPGGSVAMTRVSYDRASSLLWPRHCAGCYRRAYPL